MFGATLNVGQHYRRRAYINPALVQTIVSVPPACRYRQHEVLTRAEWILASDADPIFNRQWVGVGTARPTAQQTRGLNGCWFDAVPVSQKVGQNCTTIGSTSRVCWEC